MATGTGSEGPFSHRALLILEEKGILYRPNYVDATQKPDWVSKADPKGTLPILKASGRDLGSGQFIPDSDAISDFLEDKYGPDADAPGHRLGKVADCQQPAPQLWPKFQAFLKAPAGSEEEKKARGELLEQLQMVEAAVPNEHPYVGGKGWDFGEELDNVKAYLHRWIGRPSWRNTASWDDDSIAADLRRKIEA
ncbi:dehydroascorbate reductase [Chlorella sorokiniana]|uniref:Dehydroascorbate reductase n=1 Tax=Chlorella sorokiniana TaxID=3076 RepID=A0A2P6TBM7_CHLSO|nr:dehydroascorbate reductase [Chlorella sorokiniana]|eukprot:PRW05946.1 dehydroascorbate reductase [Chlorella sorokiniana]